MSSDVFSLPCHVAIIMDGNGRWAEKKSKNRLMGHQQGAETLREIIQESLKLGVLYLTVYAFSTENWKRPVEEVTGLMSLLKFYMEKEVKTLKKEGIRVRFIGERETLSSDILHTIEETERATETNNRFTLVVAFNYGSRNEITRAIKKIATDCLSGNLMPQEISEEVVGSFLDTKDIPDPDLLIRTSGEYRISNFLLWQCSYAEFFFTETLWPAFSKEEYKSILNEFSLRERRCGKTSSQLEKYS